MLLKTQFLTVASLHIIFLWRPSQPYCYGIGSCTCESRTEGFIIHCRGKQLTAIPQFTIPPEMSSIIFYELNLEGNAINAISDGAFQEIKFRRIVLSDNPINLVSDNAFYGLDKYLQELFLTFEKGNTEVDIPVVALRNLTNLKILEIKYYAKEVLPKNAFATLVNLEQLTLSFGNLLSLSQDELLHQSKLVNLSLEGNQFTSIPTIFKTAVGNLSTLRLDSNQIGQISMGAFEGVRNLKILDISLNAIQFVDNDAFAGLEGSLQSLSCRTCRLEDAHLPSFKSLRSLKELIIPGNSLTAMDNVLRGMKSLQNLQKLNVQGNAITSLSGSVFNDMSNSLKVLDLSDNPFGSIPPDTFISLRKLRDLQLNNIAGLELDQNTFISQRTTLTILSLSGAHFQSPQWAAVSNLTALQILVLSNCNISYIPDFAFELNGNLADLDLSDNNIASLTQRSLTGLQNSLVRLILSHNFIETLDACVFYQFSKLDFNRFGINNNPLRCSCALQWLYIRLKPYVTQLTVKCQDGSDFLSSDTVSSNCTTLELPCENLIPSTVAPPVIQVTIADLTSTNLIVSWTLRSDLNLQNFYVAYRKTGNVDFITLTLNVSDQEYSISGLAPDTTYEVCALVRTNLGIQIQTCTNATTMELPVILSNQAVIGISVAGAVGIVIIIVIAIVMTVQARRRSAKRTIVQPHTGNQSHRFTRTVAPPPTLDNTLTQTLNDMSDMEKFRLLNLLTTSSSSMPNLDNDRPDHGGKSCVRRDASNSNPSLNGAHIYEEIADYETYDNIDESAIS